MSIVEIYKFFFGLFRLEPPTEKLVSLSSAFLRVYEDDPRDPNFFEVPKRKEPKTKVLFEISMYGAKVDIETKKHGFLKSARTTVISIECCSASNRIELMFNSKKDEKSFLEWNKYIKESEEILTSRINRLCNAQCTLVPIITGQTKLYCRRRDISNHRRKPSLQGNFLVIRI